MSAWGTAWSYCAIAVRKSGVSHSRGSCRWASCVLAIGPRSLRRPRGLGRPDSVQVDDEEGDVVRVRASLAHVLDELVGERVARPSAQLAGPVGEPGEA